MTYKFLTEVAHDLQHEEGHPEPERIDYLEDLAKDLRVAILRADQLAATPKPTPPALGGAKNLAKFHSDVAARQTALESANALVVTYRQWITRMGGKLDAAGNLDRAASHRVVRYDHELRERGLTKVGFNAHGHLLDAGGKPLDTSKMVTASSGPGHAIYVMSATGSIHVSSHSVGERHHSSLLAASEAWISGAGEIRVRNGELLWISNKSGHYQPTLNHFLQVLHQLHHKHHVPLTFGVTFFNAHGRAARHASVAAFMTANALTDDSYDLFNLIVAYGQHLNAHTLAPNGWEYRRAPAEGVYDIRTGALVPHRQVRSWLKHHGSLGAPQEHSGAGR